MGHKQFSFVNEKNKSRWNHGGELRKKRKGRGYRPLSTKHSVHLVLKVRREKLKQGFRSPRGFKICSETVRTYAKRFFVKVEQLAICGDHIHILIRLTRRSQGLNFFRVVAGQIAQRFKNLGLWVTDTHRKYEYIWKGRPYARVVLGPKAWETARDYVLLNRLEAEFRITYRKARLRGLSAGEWKLLTGER